MTKLGGIEMFKNKIKPGIRGVIIERNETSAGRKVGEWVHIGAALLRGQKQPKKRCLILARRMRMRRSPSESSEREKHSVPGDRERVSKSPGRAEASTIAPKARVRVGDED